MSLVFRSIHDQCSTAPAQNENWYLNVRFSLATDGNTTENPDPERPSGATAEPHDPSAHTQQANSDSTEKEYSHTSGSPFPIHSQYLGLTDRCQE
jgi:hypothetical protein